jgi:hypothetical protein
MIFSENRYTLFRIMLSGSLQPPRMTLVDAGDGKVNSLKSRDEKTAGRRSFLFDAKPHPFAGVIQKFRSHLRGLVGEEGLEPSKS